MTKIARNGEMRNRIIDWILRGYPTGYPLADGDHEFLAELTGMQPVCFQVEDTPGGRRIFAFHSDGTLSEVDHAPR